MNEAQFAELVRRRPDLARHFHFVRGNLGRAGYYRRIPPIYKDVKARPKPLLRVQLALSKSAYKSYGKKGFRPFKGPSLAYPEDTGVTMLPVVAVEVAKDLKGKTFKIPAWKRAIKELTEALKEVRELEEVVTA